MNDIAVIKGISYAASLGYKRVRTGDGADMAFCGYQYLFNENRREQLTKEYPYMSPASKIVGKEFGVSVSNPFLDIQVVRMVLGFSDDLLFNSFENASCPGDAVVQKVLSMTDKELEAEYSEVMVKYFRDTVPKSSHMWGKLALRIAAQGILPQTIAWRQKTDLQFGSGADGLQTKIGNIISEQQYQSFKNDGYVLYNKTHGALLYLFQKLGLSAPKPKEHEYACIGCGGGVPIGRRHCKTCGAYPADAPSKK